MSAAPNWQGLFNWSMKYQDGTYPTGEVKPLPEEDRAWFEEAVKQYTVDLTERMVKIKNTLDNKEESPESVSEKEALLDELIEIVDNIDYARDLTTIGGLETLMNLLQSPHPTLRARAAEVAATCVQINPPVQEWFMKGNALPRLLALLADPDATVRTKALLALSCLIRNNPEGLNAFLTAGGAQTLVSLLQQRDPANADARIERKVLQLLGYIAREKPFAVPALILLPAMLTLIDSSDREVREAALSLLVQLAKDRDTLHELQKDESLALRLEEREKQLTAMDVEDLDAQREELHHVQHLLQLIRGQAQPEESPSTKESTAVPAVAPAVPQQPPLLLAGPQV